MTPEQKARQKIDQQLDQCGWMVQDDPDMDISAGLGVAVREFPLTTGLADYLLYVDRQGRRGHRSQARGSYPHRRRNPVGQVHGRPAPNLPHYRLPLPFAYETTGTVTQFTNALDPIPEAGRSSPSIGPRN